MTAIRDRGWWRAHLRRIDREDITTKAYAEREGIACASLYYWRRVFKDEMQAGEQPRFVPVQLVPGADGGRTTAPGVAYSLELGPGLRLQMNELPNPRWLAAIVEGELQMSPFADALYVFINRARTSIKALYWDRNGFCLWQKRLEKDRFAWATWGSVYGQPQGQCARAAVAARGL